MRAIAALLVLAAGLSSPADACGVSAENAGRPKLTLARATTAETDGGVAITFIAHASFLIETPEHVTAVTDYNGVNIPAEPPVIATMNHAHGTHYTLNPDPRIRYVLHGWREGDRSPQYDLTVQDLRVRNLPTNIRGYGTNDTEYEGNSIFVFESSGLCIAHLGHLHHLLTDDDVAALGPLDVVMVPADGVWTMNYEDVAAVMRTLHAPITIPFHYYGSRAALDRFLRVASPGYHVRFAGSDRVVLDRTMLPSEPEILVLDGGPG